VPTNKRGAIEMISLAGNYLQQVEIQVSLTNMLGGRFFVLAKNVLNVRIWMSKPFFSWIDVHSWIRNN